MARWDAATKFLFYEENDRQKSDVTSDCIVKTSSSSPGRTEMTSTSVLHSLHGASPSDKKTDERSTGYVPVAPASRNVMTTALFHNMPTALTMNSARTVNVNPGWSPLVTSPTFQVPGNGRGNQTRGLSVQPALTWLRTESSYDILYERESEYSGNRRLDTNEISYPVKRNPYGRMDPSESRLCPEISFSYGNQRNEPSDQSGPINDDQAYPVYPIQGRGGRGSRAKVETNTYDMAQNVETLCELMSRSRLPVGGSDTVCNFCKRNGEMKRVYNTHRLIEHGKITCPILRMYVCPICGATGDDAHTLSYCPLGNGASSVAATRTPKKSCGCSRTCRHSNNRHH